MPQTYDIVIRGGKIATASDVFDADLAVAGEEVVAIGRDLGPARREIDARGKLVLPGGVDSHCHVEQLSANGKLNADSFESATMSAAFGGTTTIIPFAAQHRGMNLTEVVADYHRLAERGAIIDYAFHMIIANPTPKTIEEDVPALVAKGHASLKVFMTYDRLKIDDEELLDVLVAARKSGALVCVHAENHGLISWMGKRLVAQGHHAPKFHAPSHPRAAEAEALNRLVEMAAFVDQPVMAFHISTAEGAAVIHAARGRGVKIFAETCPQYLFLTQDDLDKPGVEGAKWMCSPPLRLASDQDALWRAIALGDIEVLSSDHAPYRLDADGKYPRGEASTFKEIANGMPGIEARLPLLFDAMVSKGRLGIRKFVETTATAPARIYNLERKGSIAVGLDADLAIWDPEHVVTLDDAMMHDNAGYSPYAGRMLRGWPQMVLSRGRVVVEGGQPRVAPGSGRFLARSGGPSAAPAGRLKSDDQAECLMGRGPSKD